MELQEIENEITTLKAENKAIELKKSAFTAGGSAIGFLIAYNKKLSFWARLGYSFAGASLARVPMAFIYAEKIEQNKARITALENMKVSVVV